jgi:hypothetical protein
MESPATQSHRLYLESGRLLFCSDMRIAAKRGTRVRLSRGNREDFIDAYVDRLKSKGGYGLQA